MHNFFFNGGMPGGMPGGHRRPQRPNEKPEDKDVRLKKYIYSVSSPDGTFLSPFHNLCRLSLSVSLSPHTIILN